MRRTTSSSWKGSSITVITTLGGRFCFCKSGSFSRGEQPCKGRTGLLMCLRPGHVAQGQAGVWQVLRDAELTRRLLLHAEAVSSDQGGLQLSPATHHHTYASLIRMPRWRLVPPYLSIPVNPMHRTQAVAKKPVSSSFSFSADPGGSDRQLSGPRVAQVVPVC